MRTLGAMHRRLIGAGVVVVVADQATKAVALAQFDDGGWRAGPLRFTVVHNSGGPFGFGSGATPNWTILTAAIVVAVLAAVANERLGPSQSVAVGALIGGGLGNLTDRLFRTGSASPGAVVDWISIDPYPRVFNLADVALCAAAAALLISMIKAHGTPSAGRSVVIDVDDVSFFPALDEGVSIVDFSAPWCGPCTRFHPVFDQAALAHGNDSLRFLRVDVDQSPGLSSAFEVSSMPTIIVFDAHGQQVDRQVGVPNKRRLNQMIRAANSPAPSDGAHRRR